MGFVIYNSNDTFLFEFLYVFFCYKSVQCNIPTSLWQFAPGKSTTLKVVCLSHDRQIYLCSEFFSSSLFWTVCPLNNNSPFPISHPLVASILLSVCSSIDLSALPEWNYAVFLPLFPFYFRSIHVAVYIKILFPSVTQWHSARYTYSIFIIFLVIGSWVFPPLCLVNAAVDTDLQLAVSSGVPASHSWLYIPGRGVGGSLCV